MLDRSRSPRIVALIGALALVTPFALGQVEIEKGDHIVILGNGLADRMQHDGWLEAYLQAEYPELQLVIRNHGFTGDRVASRPRNKGFMTADEYLTLSQASVVLAMFGYNESYDGNPDGFRAELVTWINETKEKDYSGSGPPRIVLFSPIGHENLKDQNFPNGKENNARLGAYTEAMASAATETGVGFVNLFGPSLHLYGHAKAPLTINGIHLTSEGNHQIARVIVEAVRGAAPKVEAARIEKIREAVLDKNWHWFNRYRATDGNDVWGGRSHLKFTDGQTNRVVMQRELAQLDVMTANRDVVIWAAASGTTVEANDSNVPAPIEVKTNFDVPQSQGGKSKLGALEYLGGEEAIGKMELAEGMEAQLFASEEMFPELVNPVQLGVDTRGRLWAAAWTTYPKWEPTRKMDDRLLILPDEDRDGVADKAITFAYVHNPTGFEFWNGGVIVASAPDLLFLKDTDGDNVADVRVRLLGGLNSSDTHHSANNLVYGPCGFIYYQRGVFNVSNVETPWQENQHSGRSAMYRFNPRTHEFSWHADNNPNPHGISFDYWGYHYATDGTGGRAFQVKPDGKGGFGMRTLLKHTVRPVPSSGILSSTHFPPRNQGNFLICNAIAFLGIKQYTLAFDTENGDVNGSAIEDLLVSSDPNFRPTDFEIGDDGALYVADWANAIIGHMQHNIRDPHRDHAHGRIYRITVPARPLSPHVDIDGQPIETLLAALEHPINGIRHRARVELSERDTVEVIAATRQWIAGLKGESEAEAHQLLEALWVHQQHNIVDRKLLDRVLASPVAHARIAARTVRQFWVHNAAQPVDAIPAPTAAEGRGKPPEGAIVIKTIKEKMMYDVTSFTVKAGQRVTIWFENPDYMPHNLIVGKPGSAEEIGVAAEKLGADGFAAGFVPESDNILVASKLLNHQKSQLLQFSAPRTPGDCDFLCTFPGHWRMMRGIMKVVE